MAGKIMMPKTMIAVGKIRAQARRESRAPLDRHRWLKLFFGRVEVSFSETVADVMGTSW
jgi:hypothetical protein